MALTVAPINPRVGFTRGACLGLWVTTLGRARAATEAGLLREAVIVESNMEFAPLHKFVPWRHINPPFSALLTLGFWEAAAGPSTGTVASQGRPRDSHGAPPPFPEARTKRSVSHISPFRSRRNGAHDSHSVLLGRMTR